MGVLAALGWPLVAPRYFVFLATLVAVNAVVAIGLNLLSGYTNQLSFGHAGFLAIGAYTAAILTLHAPALPVPLTLLAAGLLTALVGLALGIPCLRLDGLYLAMATLAFGFVVVEAITNLDPQAAEDPPPAHIVLLSDGDNTTGRPVEEAAQAAVDAHVPVSTIAYGTPNGTLHGKPVPADTNLLRQLAETTKGKFYQAASGEELRGVYADVGSSIGFRTQRKDLSVFFVGLALLAALAVAVPSLLWFARLA